MNASTWFAQVLDGAEVAAPQELADQDAQPDLDLVHPGRVLGRVVEDDRVARIAQERGPRGLRAQDAATYFDAEIVGACRPASAT